VFLRLVGALEVTETFKLKKQPLAADGWDAARAMDPLFVEDRTAGGYAAVDDALAARIRSGEMRF